MDTAAQAGTKEADGKSKPGGGFQELRSFLKPQANECRTVLNLGGFWEFRRDTDRFGEELGWQRGFVKECELAVPGSWNEQRLELMHYFGLGWYQTHFAAPPEWAFRHVSLHFGCAQFNTKVWLNGTYVGQHVGGSLPFVFELNHHLSLGGENILVVAVDASIDPWALPPGRLETSQWFEGFHRSNPPTSYDFFPYGGLSRPVSLQVTSGGMRLDDIKCESSVNASARTVRCKVWVWISGKLDGEARCRLGGTTRSTHATAEGRVIFEFLLEDVRLWSDLDPYLYTVNVELWNQDSLVDTYQRRVGFREVRIEKDRLLLNGRPIFLQGFGKHEDFPIVGRGLVEPLVVKDFDLLRWMGANSFRTSHYPYAEEWYEYADRTGVLVIGETPFVGLNDRMLTREMLGQAKGVLSEMIRRDHEHPSVIMWSVGNEPTIRSDSGHNFFRELVARARNLDRSRLVTYVAHEEPEQNLALEDVDIVCVNKYFGWYDRPGDLDGSREMLSACLDRFRSRFGKPVLLAEFGADALPGMHALPAEMFSEEYQAEILEAQIEVARSKPWVIGIHVWAFADFKVGQSVTRAIYNHKGVLTRDRQPKAGAFALRRLWLGTNQRT